MTKKTDPFAAYALPLGLTEGVDIPLEGTPAVFRVDLPSSMNESFTVDLMVRLSETRGDGDRVNGVKLQAIRKDLFFETCILDVSGIPEGMTAGQFFELYPVARRVIFERAMELADEAEQEVNEALGKLKPTPNGKSSGVGSSTSTKHSSKRDANQQQPAPI